MFKYLAKLFGDLLPTLPHGASDFPLPLLPHRLRLGERFAGGLWEGPASSTGLDPRRAGHRFSTGVRFGVAPSYLEEIGMGGKIYGFRLSSRPHGRGLPGDKVKYAE